MIGELPLSLRINDKDYPIRTDFRDILTIIQAFNDPDLEDEEKVYVCFDILFGGIDVLDPTDYEEAFKQATWFMDTGRQTGADDRPSPKVMDWEQDEPLVFPAINKVAGTEVRALEYLHWWTFMGYFMEISDGAFSHILNLRVKKSRNKKLEKWEREYWQNNKAVCELRRKISKEEQEERDAINKMFQ